MKLKVLLQNSSADLHLTVIVFIFGLF